ncbi:pentatricopeptide repeat domain-containing protein [Spizellomyces punctatus DAOM BR117]|uniref:Pentatricopeptide repeat domain-containing protein n=1 Tax=Spizellomyces punctatus (strain DAOM BR117) TaxID=645134 RepID=A0A0L0HVM9_SPIPD|nr:pentatricopeptide repeat domain-containing protein [Spizellomyces punctatus DAOM BR117]KND04939.1 pentatricopeptide repeat domain-containing protein [Spizellomyces punctatus DAOM BR117]|eukprot:XP_016612978.1 pentatricopeptide repeat domain-containing protein [Spizellomyces punctatus DAOM BR117]
MHLRTALRACVPRAGHTLLALKQPTRLVAPPILLSFRTASTEPAARRVRDVNTLVKDPNAFKEFKRALDLNRYTEIWRWYRVLYRTRDLERLSSRDFYKVVLLVKENRVFFERNDAARVRILNQIWTAMANSKIKPDPTLCKLFVELYGRAGDLANLEKVQAYMKEAGFPVLEKGVQQWIMLAAARTGNFDQAQRIYEFLKTSDAERDRVLANSLLMGYSRGRYEQPMLQLFEDMKSSGPAPDSLSHYHVLDYYASVGNIEEMEKWFAIMRKISSRPLQSAYNVAIYAYLAANQLDKSRELFKEVEQHNYVPDYRHDDLKVALAAHEGDTITAWKSFRRAYATRKKVASVQVMINLAKATGPVKVEDLEEFKKTLALAEYPMTANVLSYLLRGYRGLRDPVSAETVLRWMASKKWTTHGGHYADVIGTYLVHGDVENAKRLFNEVREKGQGIDKYSYAALVRRCVKENKLAEAALVLDNLERDDMFISVGLVESVRETLGAEHELVKRLTARFEEKVQASKTAKKTA